MIEREYEIAIVGAGPCGVTTANLLGGYGIRTLLIDKEPDVLSIPRAIGICEEGSRIFAAAGLYDVVSEDIRPIDRVYFNNKAQERVFFMDTSRIRNGYRTLSTFYQPKLERDIRSALTRYPNVDFFTETECLDFEDHGEYVQLQLQKQEVEVKTRCRYLLACDGARSPIRKALDIGFRGKTYRQDWVVIDATQNPVPRDFMAFSIDPGRPGITLPGPGDRRRWEFVIKHEENAEQLLEEEQIDKLLAPWGGLKDITLERKAIYTFHARVAEQFRKGNVFLLGDAAHITPPFAGQGMMAGLRDSYNLCWKLAGVINGKLGAQVLESYEAERIPQAHQVIRFAQSLGSVILPQSHLIAKLRDGLFKALEVLKLHSPGKGVRFDKVPNHINGRWIRHVLVNKWFKRGVELPQFRVRIPDGKTCLMDQYLGDDFFLLGWECDPLGFLKESTLKRWRAVSGKSAVFAQPSAVKQTSPSPSPSLFDVEGKYREFFQDDKRVVLVRPDRMVMVNCRPARLDELVNKYLNRVCLHAVGSPLKRGVIHAG